MGQPTSESERGGHLLSEIVFRHRGIDMDGVQLEMLGFLLKAFCEHVVTFRNVAASLCGIAGLPYEPLPWYRPTLDGGLAEIGCGKKPDCVLRSSKQRFHKVRQQPKSLDDDAWLLRQAKEIFNDQAEALALKPVEGLNPDPPA
ncbi:hypothetical protein [Streptomyces sp. NPDC058424]|uniref:hypothetical protein n=1 Tax=Streptomyces sp. NPDC058424 TaxID=3346491 RepID=UPI00364C2E54